MTIWLEFNRKVACPIEKDGVRYGNIQLNPGVGESFNIIYEDGDNYCVEGSDGIKYGVSKKWYCVVWFNSFNGTFFSESPHCIDNISSIIQMGINEEKSIDFSSENFENNKYEISYDFFNEYINLNGSDHCYRPGDEIVVDVDFNIKVDGTTLNNKSCIVSKTYMGDDSIGGVQIEAESRDDGAGKKWRIHCTLPEDIKKGRYHFIINDNVKSAFKNPVDGKSDLANEFQTVDVEFEVVDGSADYNVPVDDFKPGEGSGIMPTKEDVGKAFDMAGQVLGVIINVGIILTVIMITVIGLKFMLSSPSEKAEYMKSALPLIVGAFLLVSSVGIVKLIASSIGD